MRISWIDQANPTQVFASGDVIFNRATNSFIHGDGLTAGGIAVRTDPTTTSYTFNQAVASSVWTISHKLGFRPGVICYDSAGTQIIGDVHHIDQNNLTVSYSSATGGQAFLS